MGILMVQFEFNGKQCRAYWQKIMGNPIDTQWMTHIGEKKSRLYGFLFCFDRHRIASSFIVAFLITCAFDDIPMTIKCARWEKNIHFNRKQNCWHNWSNQNLFAPNDQCEFTMKPTLKIIIRVTSMSSCWNRRSDSPKKINSKNIPCSSVFRSKIARLN